MPSSRQVLTSVTSGLSVLSDLFQRVAWFRAAAYAALFFGVLSLWFSTTTLEVLIRGFILLFLAGVTITLEFIRAAFVMVEDLKNDRKKPE